LKTILHSEKLSSTLLEKLRLANAALTARFPLFLAAFHRLRNDLEPLESVPELGHAANYLYMLSGQMPEERHVKALDAYLVLLAEHGLSTGNGTLSALRRYTMPCPPLPTCRLAVADSERHLPDLIDELEQLVPLSSYLMLVPRHGPRGAAARAGLLRSNVGHR